MSREANIQGALASGDNLLFLRRIPDAVVDLVVTDPPFCTGSERRATSGAAEPDESSNRTTSALFNDRWADLESYLQFLCTRLQELHRILKPTGSLVIHLDYRAVHEIKIELDRLFGRKRFVNEIIWHYTGGGRARRYFSRKHDTLLWYARGSQWTFHIDELRQPYKPTSGYARSGIVSRAGKRYLPHPDGTPVDDVWDIPLINPMSKERTGFPTQKPEQLLDRLIRGLSSPGDLVCDPFCGSGTTLVVAQRLGRRWIGADRNGEAIRITRQRLGTLATEVSTADPASLWSSSKPTPAPSVRTGSPEIPRNDFVVFDLEKEPDPARPDSANRRRLPEA